MYTYRYCQYLNLPKIPNEIIVKLPTELSGWKMQHSYGNYNWTPHNNEEIDRWCKENICSDMYWAFQLMTGDVTPHRDIPTKTKLVYLIDTGGAKVDTCFWDDARTEKVASYTIPKNQWHILKVDSYHSVEGIEPGKLRWSVTGRIF